MKELSVDGLVQEVLTRNPSLAQMTAAWQAASARYPQVTSLEDPMFAATFGPGTIAPDDRGVEFASRLETRGRGSCGRAVRTRWRKRVLPRTT